MRIYIRLEANIYSDPGSMRIYIRLEANIIYSDPGSMRIGLVQTTHTPGSSPGRRTMPTVLSPASCIRTQETIYPDTVNPIPGFEYGKQFR